MAQAYWTGGRADVEAVFSVSFRRAPFGGGYALACGLADALARLETFAFEPDDLAYLATLRATDGSPVFRLDFLDMLASFRPTLDVDAMPEGTPVFPFEPLLRARGGLMEAQIVETTVLNALNFPTLVATKASRIVTAAGDAPVIEFGLRRAQGADGGLTASRAAFIGGCQGTSNVLAGREFGIPVRGTHAHSWVLSFDSEPRHFGPGPRRCRTNRSFSWIRSTRKWESTTRSPSAATCAGTATTCRASASIRATSRISRTSRGASSTRQGSRRRGSWPPTTSTRRRSSRCGSRTRRSMSGASGRSWSRRTGSRRSAASTSSPRCASRRLMAARAQSVRAARQDNGAGHLSVRRYYDERGTAAGDAIVDELTDEARPLVVVHPTAPHRRKRLEGLRNSESCCSR